MSNQLKEFLESQAKKNPIRVNGSRFSWEEKKARSSRSTSGSSGLLDAIYLNKPPEETVIVERSVAAMIQGRISNMEVEITRLRARIRLFKIALLIFFVGMIMLVVEVFLLLGGG